MDFETLAGYDKAKWHSLAEAAKPETRLFIDGDYVDAQAGGRVATAATTGSAAATPSAPATGRGWLRATAWWCSTASPRC